MKKGFIICWFGLLPVYLPVWLRSCAYNSDYDFLLFTDATIDFVAPPNVKVIPFTMERFIERCRNKVDKRTVITKPYRICDFRPMYGIIFENELKPYDFWGYCDIDIVLGKINKFIKEEDFKSNDAIFNGGHFTLIKNNELMNNLYTKPGALFDYKAVASKEAIYAFDETTGFQNIARNNNIKAKFGIPYIETESKYSQLRSRLEKRNPDAQCFYWEDGNLFRVKEEDGRYYYQEIAYIHLQKRKLLLLDHRVTDGIGIWIMPNGFSTKDYNGFPQMGDIKSKNPGVNLETRNKEERIYKMNKTRSILSRGLYQLYVRIKQQFAGINAGDGAREEMMWKEYSYMQ